MGTNRTRLAAPGPQQGFTILEMMVVLVMVGLCASMAAASFGRVMKRSQARSSVDELLVVLHRARSDASTRMRHEGVVVAPDESVSFRDASGTVRKGIRFAVFVDAEALGTPGTFDPQDTILAPWVSMGRTFSYSTSSSGLSAGVASVVFHTDGSSDNDLSMVLGISDFQDTFRLSLLPATGLATLER